MQELSEICTIHLEELFQIEQKDSYIKVLR